jgi:apolipoprotein N-acyltransferase
VNLLLVFFIGLLLPFAFAPLNVYVLAFIVPAILLHQWQKSTPRQAFIKGGLFGLGFYSTGVSWVYISIHTYGNASTWVAGIITLAMIVFLALGPATQGYLLTKVFGKKNPLLFCLAAFPATWVIWEWLRSLPLNGFPWLYLGYTQLNTPLRGYAPILGVFGVTLAVAIISGCGVLLSTRQSNKIKFWSLAVLIFIIGGGWLLSKHAWTKPSGVTLPVTLVQANISQSIKWNPDEFIKIVHTYERLTQPYWQNSRLIIWPEAALPAFPQQIPQLIEKLAQAAKPNNTLLTGILLGDPINKPYFNGVLLLGANQGEYRKRHLVPFGEYTPLASVFAFLINYWHIPMSDFSAGAVTQPILAINGIKIATFICYEIAYPIEFIRYSRNSELIVNISDDSWFGRSMASAQQAQMAQLRAIEAGRFVLLGANTGITGIINPQGRVIAVLPADQSGVLTGNVTPMSGNTPLQRWNYYPLLTILLLLLLISLSTL